MKIAVLTYTSCLSEGKYHLGDHAYMTSDMQIIYEFNILIIQMDSQTNHYAFTISCVQDSCLEHAERLGALQNFENYISPPFSYFQNNLITT